MEYKIVNEQKLTFGKKVTTNSYYDIVLNDNELFRFDNSRKRVRLLCLKGILWISQSGNMEDYLLQPGDSFISQAGRVVLAQAMQKGSMRVSLSG